MPKRPTILVAEPEPAEALSVRKLILETAKFNVLTAHSTREAIDIFHSFPNISAVIAVDADDINCEVVTMAIKDAVPKIHAIALSARAGYRCTAASHHVSSHEPEQLLRLVRELLGDPRSFVP